MTKISKKSAYPVKIPVRKDYFVGTDSENNGKTVNFDFESVAKIVGGINGTSALSYRFKTDYNIDLAVLTGGVFLSAENETTVSSISKLYINKEDFYETNLSELFRFIALNRESFIMKLRNSSNLNNAVYFKITGATEYETHFALDVAIDINNASLLELINYNVYFFDFELSSSDLAITLPEFNKIITETGFTSTETEITFNPLWVWLIKNVSYSNTTSVTKTTTPTTLGSKRIDVFVLNSSNTFETISGAETTGSPVKPTIPLDTLEVTFCIVGDGGIETVEPINIIDYATIVYVDSKDVLKVDKVSGYSLTKNDLTDLLKTTYDSAVNWISVNGSNLLSHILRTDNPHNVTATQVGAPSGSGTSTGTNTGDQDLSTKVDKVTGKSLISDTEIIRLAGVSNADVSGKEDVTNKSQTLTVSSVLYPSNNSVISAITAADSGNVKLTGSQTITGVKTHTNGVVFLTTNSAVNAVVVTSGTTGATGLKGTVQAGGGNAILLTSNHSGSGGSSSTMLSIDNVAVNNDLTPIRIKKQGAEVAKIDYLGKITGTELINSTAPATNILLADGSTIAQSSISVDVSGKVDKVTGKSLISDTEITRLAGVSNVDISGKENTITAGTTAQYYRGDKTMQTLDKTAVGLANVDNTTDLSKPISSATQTAINLKANIASPTFTGTVSGVTATMVGLGNVNNTTDLLKPVSTDTQTALNLKANLASPTFTGTVSGITKTMVGLANVDNTTDLLKPISTATQTALNGKQATLTNPITGTGIIGYLPKFTSAGVLGNSIVQEVGTEIQVAGSGKFTDLLTVSGASQGSLDIKRGTTQAYRFFVDINDFGIYDLIGDKTVFSIKNTTGDSTITGKLKALCPVYTNDAAADADGTLLSGQFYKLIGSRAVYQKP